MANTGKLVRTSFDPDDIFAEAIHAVLFGAVVTEEELERRREELLRELQNRSIDVPLALCQVSRRTAAPRLRTISVRPAHRRVRLGSRGRSEKSSRRSRSP